MAIEDDEPKDREVWSNVARFWYNKAADKSPNVGRLYHHLAILARPYTLEQLSLYTRSLTCVTPFESAKGSIMTLFNPILSGKESATRRSSFFETLFIKAHGILFTKGPLDPSDGFDEIMKELENDSLFDSYITKNAARFKETGVFAAVANIAALFEYGVAKKGVTKPILRLEFESFQDANKVKDEAPQPSSLDSAGSPRDPQPGGPADSEYDGMSANISDSSLEAISLASKIAFFTLRTSLRRGDDVNTYPLVHVYLVFLWSLVSIQKAMKCIESYIPWNDICSFLTVVAAQAPAEDEKFRCKDFPKSEQGVGRPLPEDFILRGQTYSQWYFPETWFTDAMIDDDERSLELPSMAVSRSERLLWLGSRIADVGPTPLF